LAATSLFPPICFCRRVSAILHIRVVFNPAPPACLMGHRVLRARFASLFGGVFGTVRTGEWLQSLEAGVLKRGGEGGKKNGTTTLSRTRPGVGANAHRLPSLYLVHRGTMNVQAEDSFSGQCEKKSRGNRTKEAHRSPHAALECMAPVATTDSLYLLGPCAASKCSMLFTCWAVVVC